MAKYRLKYKPTSTVLFCLENNPTYQFLAHLPKEVPILYRYDTPETGFIVWPLFDAMSSALK